MSSSSDLETSLTQHVRDSKTKKTKKKSKHAPVVAPTPAADADAVADAKNEGDDPHWAYAPPEGAVLLDHSVDAGAFEWGTIKDDDDTEVWLLCVPDTLKAKHLDGLEIDVPSSDRTARIGAVVRKTGSYDIWSIGGDVNVDEDEDDTVTVGAEDLRGLTCLLPRRRKHGKLYIAPKKVARHIVVCARPSVATPPASQPVVQQNPARPSYPKEVLKHTFVPYGARSQESRSEDVAMAMDVDEIEMETAKPTDEEVPSPPKEKPAKTKSKGKKRKVEGESPKKSKKHKTDV